MNKAAHNGEKAPDGVSIVMACYNGERYIRPQIDSLLNQSHPFDELIFIDDNSTDSTAEIIKEYDDERLSLYQNQRNKGVVQTFEKGLRLVKYSHVFLCDQDDIWNREKIEKMVEKIGSHSAIYCNAIIISENENYHNKYYRSLNPLFGRDSNSEELLSNIFFHSIILGCCLMIKREVIGRIVPIPNTARNHDWWISLICALGGGIKYLEAPLTKYRIHDNNLTVKPGHWFYGIVERAFLQRSKIRNYRMAALLAAGVFERNHLSVAAASDLRRSVFRIPVVGSILYTIKWRNFIFPNVARYRRFIFAILRPMSF